MAGEWKEAQHEEGTLKALVVHDPMLSLDRSVGSVALADDRPGPWRPGDPAARGVLDPGGEYLAGPETLTLRCSRGGYPVADGCEFVVEADGTAYGWDNATMVRGSRRVLSTPDVGATGPDRTRALVPLPDGRLLWIGDREGPIVAAGGSAWLRWLASDEWAHDAESIGRLTPYPEPAISGERRRGTDACILPDGRVLAVMLTADAATAATSTDEWFISVVSLLSDGSGDYSTSSAFAVQSEAAFVGWLGPIPDFDSAEASMYDVECSVAYSGGQVLLLVRLGYVVHQFASRDDGATFELIDSGRFGSFGAFASTCYAIPGGGFVIALSLFEEAIPNPVNTLRVRRIGSAFTAAQGLPTSPTGWSPSQPSPVLIWRMKGVVADTGEHYLYIWSSVGSFPPDDNAEADSSGICVQVSYDGGASFNPSRPARSQVLARSGQWVGFTEPRNLTFGACWQGARAWIALGAQGPEVEEEAEGSPNSATGIIAAIALGGHAEVPQAVQRIHGPRDRATYIARLHWTMHPDNYNGGFTMDAPGWAVDASLPAVRLAQATPEGSATVALSGNETRTRGARFAVSGSGDGGLGSRARVELATRIGGSSTDGIRFEVRLALTASGMILRLEDTSSSPSTLAEADVLPDTLYEVQVYHRGQDVVVWYREHDTDERAAWTLLYDSFVAIPSPATKLAVVDLTAASIASAVSVILVPRGRISYASVANLRDRVTYTTGLTASANLQRRRGRRLAPIPTYVTGGLYASMSRGPAITGQTWQSAPASASLRAASWTANSPSPSRAMQLAAATGTRDLRWIRGEDTAYLQPNMLAAVIVGSQPVLIAARITDSGTFDTAQTLNRAIRANVATRRGDIITITQRGDPVTTNPAPALFVHEDELAGGWIYYDANDTETRRRIIGNSAGLIGGGDVGDRYARIQIEPEAGDPTSASPWFVVPRVTAHILPVREDVTTRGMRFTGANTAQEMKLLLGWVRYLGEAHGDDSVHTIQPRIADTETDAGYRRRRQLGVPYREVELSWQATTERAVQLWAVPPDTLRVLGAGPVGSRGEYSTTIEAWFARWASEGTPVAYFPALLPQGDAQDLLTRQQGVPLIGTIDSGSWEVQDVGGVELRSGERRNGRLLIRELT